MDCTEHAAPSSGTRPASKWPEVLDEIFDLVLPQLASCDVATVRHVCRSWRDKATRLLRTLSPRSAPLELTDWGKGHGNKRVLSSALSCAWQQDCSRRLVHPHTVISSDPLRMSF